MRCWIPSCALLVVEQEVMLKVTGCHVWAKDPKIQARSFRGRHEHYTNTLNFWPMDQTHIPTGYHPGDSVVFCPELCFVEAPRTKRTASIMAPYLRTPQAAPVSRWAKVYVWMSRVKDLKTESRSFKNIHLTRTRHEYTGFWSMSWLRFILDKRSRSFFTMRKKGRRDPLQAVCDWSNRKNTAKHRTYAHAIATVTKSNIRPAADIRKILVSLCTTTEARGEERRSRIRHIMFNRQIT